MTGLARRTHAARGRLARLVVAVAILAGLGLAIGLQCTNAMAMPAMPAISVTHNMTSVADSMAVGASAGTADELTAPRTGAVTVIGADTSSPHGLGGVLAACLAFILAVVAAVAALRPHRARNGARLLLRSTRVLLTAVRPRAPSLAELCLLRT